jgi:hypothetical protein
MEGIPVLDDVDDVLPEVPEEIDALIDSANAATEDIIRMLVSHNPRLRPRYDRFDVNIAFRPCSEVDFDPSEFQSSRPMSDYTLQTGCDGESHSSCTLIQERDSALAICGGSFASSRSFPRLQRITSTASSAKSECSFSDLKRFSDTNRSRAPKRRLIARLLGCLGSANAAD